MVYSFIFSSSHNISSTASRGSAFARFDAMRSRAELASAAIGTVRIRVRFTECWARTGSFLSWSNQLASGWLAFQFKLHSMFILIQIRSQYMVWNLNDPNEIFFGTSKSQAGGKQVRADGDSQASLSDESTVEFLSIHTVDSDSGESSSSVRRCYTVPCTAPKIGFLFQRTAVLISKIARSLL